MEQISMPILPLVEQKQINADTIISPVLELGESRKLSGAAGRSSVDNPSRYNPKSNSTLAPGIKPSFVQFTQSSSLSGAASNVMHTYPPPQFMNYKTQHAVDEPLHHHYEPESVQPFSGQTYPGLQHPPKIRTVYGNGQQISNHSYVNGDVHGRSNGYPVTPVSTLGQQQPVFFTSSPVETTKYTTDAMCSPYYTQEPQALTHTNGEIPDFGSLASNPMQYNPSLYQEGQHMNSTQHNYPYQA
jgi:hypothetical protein